MAGASAGVARRMLICGMHVHVGIDDNDLRADLMAQLTYFLPHLLALSCSSPYWQGEDTGLASYRMTVFDNLPRTGLPPQLASWAAYERTTGTLVELGLIEDTTKIWWDLRPSGRFPTLETRICDVPPRLEDTLTLAATIQCITRMLWRLSLKNQSWRLYEEGEDVLDTAKAMRAFGAEVIEFGDGVVPGSAAQRQDVDPAEFADRRGHGAVDAVLPGDVHLHGGGRCAGHHDHGTGRGRPVDHDACAADRRHRGELQLRWQTCAAVAVGHV